MRIAGFVQMFDYRLLDLLLDMFRQPGEFLRFPLPYRRDGCGGHLHAKDIFPQIREPVFRN